MKKTSKKIISLVLAVLMLMSVWAISASAEECDHVFGDKMVVLIEATCKNEGEARITCTKCGFTKVVSTPKADHPAEYIRKLPGVAATCETPGLTEGSWCTFCGQDVVAQEKIAPLGHLSYTDIDVALPTCTTKGQGHIRCLREDCGLNELIEIPALGHKDVNGDGLCDECHSNMCKCVCHKDNFISKIFLFVNKIMNKYFPKYDRQGNQLYYHCCTCRIPKGAQGV